MKYKPITYKLMNNLIQHPGNVHLQWYQKFYMTNESILFQGQFSVLCYIVCKRSPIPFLYLFYEIKFSTFDIKPSSH